MDATQEAKRLFNETWDLMDKQGRTEDDNAMMLHKAHASCLLGQTADSAVNNARGEWQVSRVYSVLGMGGPALLYGRRSLDICVKNAIGGLDLAFGYEGVAHAYAVGGDAQKAKEYKALAIASCEGIADEADKKDALGEIGGISVSA